jgi:hypothetical protein
MMIAAKNGATTTATTVVMTGQKARGPDNFVAANQTLPPTSWLDCSMLADQSF